MHFFGKAIRLRENKMKKRTGEQGTGFVRRQGSVVCKTLRSAVEKPQQVLMMMIFT